ncbi:GNAT family N-acetyltransferase [Streptomyces sp. NPDC002888]|uniref:GNAT family N-acetyltransferase n=1 Tax=Streptomyces sp. NPDC002888 TaxID=3364668 RepID=UPI0036B5481B
MRPRVADDLADCIAVLTAVHEDGGYPVNWPARPADWLTPRSLLSAWVAELDGRIVGHVVLSHSDEGDVAPGLWQARHKGAGAAAVVNRLFVSPAARGRGIGAALLERATCEAHARGLHPVLDVVASDTAATALYERLGWELLDVVEQRWGPDRTVSLRCYAAHSS